MTPQELKNSILQLAIQGRLVEQRPEEGTAAELVEKIAHAETRRRGGKLGEGKDGLKHLPKAALTLRGTLSAPSASPREEIPDDEKPFDIPESWEWVRLGDICTDVFSGKSPTYTKLETDYRIVGQAANQQEGLNLSQLKYTNADFWNKMDERYFLRENDVLLNTLGNGTLGRSGILGALPYPLLTDGHLFVFRTSSPTSSYYLYYYLQYKRHDIEKTANGSTNQTFLSLSKTVKWVIPLPPLAEQKRIVAKIEELLPLIDRYEKAWSKLENFNKRFPVDMQKSLLQMAIQGKLVEQRPEEGTAAELLEKILAAKNAKSAKKNLTRSRGARGEKETSATSASPREKIPDDEKPFDIPESWEWVRLGEIANVLGGKRIPAGRQLTTANTGHIYIRVSDMKNDGVSMEHLMYVPSDIYPSISRYIITKEDVYITVAGTIGRVGKIPPELDGANLTENADRLVFEGIDQEWLIQCLKSAVVQNQIVDCTTKVGQPKLAIKRIQELTIPLPPLAEQKRIVAKLEELLPLCERLR